MAQLIIITKNEWQSGAAAAAAQESWLEFGEIPNEPNTGRYLLLVHHRRAAAEAKSEEKADEARQLQVCFVSSPGQSSSVRTPLFA